MPRQTKLTYGLEIEAAGLTDEADTLIDRHEFKRLSDASITAADGSALDPRGVELVSRVLEARVSFSEEDNNPRMSIDIGNGTQVLKDLCGCVSKVNKSCGFHLHLGLPDNRGKSKWSDEQIRTFLAIGMMLEPRIFSLVPSSRMNNSYCRKIAEVYGQEDCRALNPMGSISARKYSNPKRYCWLNLIETRRRGTDSAPNRGSSEAPGTVEIRMLGNTKRYEYIQAWVNLWLKIGSFVAFYPPSVAIMNCALSNGIRADIEAVRSAKELPVNRRESASTGLSDDAYRAYQAEDRETDQIIPSAFSTDQDE